MASILLPNAPAISAIAASLAFIAAVLFNRRTELRAVRPVLVFVYKENGWHIVNVGNGPALDIIVAKRRSRGRWHGAVRIPPLGKERELPLHWLQDDNVHSLGATYSSFEGLTYTSICRDDLTTMKRRRRLGSFDLVIQEWKLRSYDTTEKGRIVVKLWREVGEGEFHCGLCSRAYRLPVSVQRRGDTIEPSPIDLLTAHYGSTTPERSYPLPLCRAAMNWTDVPFEIYDAQEGSSAIIAGHVKVSRIGELEMHDA